MLCYLVDCVLTGPSRTSTAVRSTAVRQMGGCRQTGRTAMQRGGAQDFLACWGVGARGWSSCCYGGQRGSGQLKLALMFGLLYSKIQFVGPAQSQTAHTCTAKAGPQLRSSSRPPRADNSPRSAPCNRPRVWRSYTSPCRRGASRAWPCRPLLWQGRTRSSSSPQGRHTIPSVHLPT